MPVVRIARPLVAVAPELSDVDTEANENTDPTTKCGRCGECFVRHPSMGLGDTAKWWLCPPCRSRLLGDVSRTNSRWAREA
jgi:hypothetical protein